MPPSRPPGNALLNALPESALDALRPHLRTVPLVAGDIVHYAGDAIDAVLFPTSGFISVVADLAGREIVEIGIVGCEGMTGSAVALGQSTTTHRSDVQVAGEALSLPADVLRANLERDAALRAHVLRYVYATIVTISQTAVCNRVHPVDERCARWLLLAHDRVDGDTFVLAQRFLKQMLGVQSVDVTLASMTLRDAGLIAYGRDDLTVRDRPGLEDASCECYAAVERQFRTVVGYSISKGGEPRTDLRRDGVG